MSRWSADRLSQGTLDFRTNRLTPGHADRRPWIYFISASAPRQR